MQRERTLNVNAIRFSNPFFKTLLNTIDERTDLEWLHQIIKCAGSHRMNSLLYIRRTGGGDQTDVSVFSSHPLEPWRAPLQINICDDQFHGGASENLLDVGQGPATLDLQT